MRCPELYAVYCPESLDYFLADAHEAFSPDLKSKFTGNPIPAESRYVQYLPTDNMHILDKSFWRKVIPTMRRVNKKYPIPRKGKITNNPVEFVAELNSQISSLSARKEKLRTGAPEQEIARASKLVSLVQVRDQVVDEVFTGHPWTWGVVGNQGYVYNVGRGGGILFAADLAELPVLADVTMDDVKKLAKRVLFFTSLILEVIGLIGAITGTKTQPQKAADAIEEALKKRPILEALEKFFSEVAAGSKDIMGLLGALIKAFFDAGELGIILSAALSGIFTLVGLAWFIASLLAKLSGFGAAVTAIQVAAFVSGIVLKCITAYEEHQKGNM